MGSLKDTAKGLFGGGKRFKAQTAPIPNINAGGVRSNTVNGLTTITTNQARQGLISNLQDVYSRQASGIRDIYAPRYEALFGRAIDATNNRLSQVEPGVGRLTEARLAEIENARQRGQSNLRGELGRRRLLGSSFASDALTRSDLEYAQAAEESAAQGFLQELDLSNRLETQRLQQETAAANTALQNFTSALSAEANVSNVQLEEYDKLISIATQLSQLANQTAQFNAQQRQSANMAAQQAGASTFGTLLGFAAGGPVGGAIGGGSAPILNASAPLSGQSIGSSGQFIVGGGI